MLIIDYQLVCFFSLSDDIPSPNSDSAGTPSGEAGRDLTPEIVAEHKAHLKSLDNYQVRDWSSGNTENANTTLD